MNEMDSKYTLSYPLILKIFTIIFSVVTLGGLTYLACIYPIQSQNDKLSLIGLYIFTVLFSVYFYIEFFTVKITVSSLGIKGKSGWKGERNYLWPEINEISYSPASMWFKITAKNKPSLRIHALISGINIFQQYFIEYMPEEKWLSAYEKFNKTRG